MCAAKGRGGGWPPSSRCSSAHDQEPKSGGFCAQPCSGQQRPAAPTQPHSAGFKTPAALTRRRLRWWFELTCGAVRVRERMASSSAMTGADLTVPSYRLARGSGTAGSTGDVASCRRGWLSGGAGSWRWSAARSGPPWTLRPSARPATAIHAVGPRRRQPARVAQPSRDRAQIGSKPGLARLQVLCTPIHHTPCIGTDLWDGKTTKTRS
jgi:hypothetical protein